MRSSAPAAHEVRDHAHHREDEQDVDGRRGHVEDGEAEDPGKTEDEGKDEEHDCQRNAHPRP